MLALPLSIVLQHVPTQTRFLHTLCTSGRHTWRPCRKAYRAVSSSAKIITPTTIGSAITWKGTFSSNCGIARIALVLSISRPHLQVLQHLGSVRLWRGFRGDSRQSSTRPSSLNVATLFTRSLGSTAATAVGWPSRSACIRSCT